MSGPDLNAPHCPLAEANRMAARAGHGGVYALTALDGGRNNRVWRIEAGGVPLVLKSYFRDARDPRDRRGAEWAFLTHAWSRGVRNVPEPLATDDVAGLSLMSHAEGTRLAAGTVTRAHVDAAIDLILAVSAEPRRSPSAMRGGAGTRKRWAAGAVTGRDTIELPTASEACFSLAAHMETIERRLARLGQLDQAAPHADAAARFVATKLRPVWALARRRIEAAGTLHDARNPPPAAATCISPSDLGFHNALVDAAGRITFLDFEYAGRDDPAKLVSDFFCQPEVPVPIAHHPHMVDRLASGLGLGDDFRRRCAMLLDAYRIKWVCIMLNDFLPAEDARRSFATPSRRAERCAAQLAKARAAIGAIAA